MDLSENLIPNESVVFQSHKHPIAPIRDSLAPVGLLVLALIVGWIRPTTADGVLGFFRDILGLVQIGLVAAGIGWIAYNIVVWRTAAFAVTTLRVLRSEGLIQRRTSETLLSSVSDVRLSVGLLGKQLGYGDLRILTGSGDAAADAFLSITQPTEFRNAMMVQKLAEQTAQHAPAPAPAQAQAAPPAAVVAPPTARPTAAESADTIRRLAELRDQGIITPEEFEAKKTDILARI